MKPTVAIGADHAGLALKNEIATRLRETREVLDVGAYVFDPEDDYPDFALLVARAVASGKAERGILVCGSGVGGCVAANKTPGVRAGICHDTYSAHQGVEHDEMNVLCLGAHVIGVELAWALTTAFLNARPSADERHQRRRKKVLAIERQFLREGTTGQLQASSGGYATDVETALAQLGQHDIVRRIWRKDHTVWNPEPGEITDRLGWLTVTDIMVEQAPDLLSFAREVQHDRFRHVVLLGMGGSSLGAEVLRQVFGSADGYPELVVLDSTVPAAVQAVTESIAPANTLFLVSSKSGTTAEPLLLFKYFRDLVQKATGKSEAGRNFVAITDPGTPLVTLAEQEGFRRIFLNPPDIGGRYSVLSYFGLVPAALMGIDVATLLQRAVEMCKRCAPGVPDDENPGACLGAWIGALAQRGRDKLTLLTSPSIASFGLWIEQLIAESTGKDGKGIVPVAGEPSLQPASYGSDRLFVYLRLKDADNAATDAAIAGIRSSVQPVLVMEMKDRYDLGAEFFRWEFATAVAGALIGVHPFNQPDVQKAKDRTDSLLRQYLTSHRLPQPETAATFADLLKHAAAGKYLAIMAYVRQTPEMDDVFARLRRKVQKRYHIATTLGYGPRFLHSTGQLHKGGPDTGLFLQVTVNHEKDVPIPGEAYTFGVVADAQALGDLQALQAAGRHVVRIHAPGGDALSISKLIARLL